MRAVPVLMKVALVSDASALPGRTDPADAAAGMESAAAFLRYHSGLEITPLPVESRDGSLAEAITALDPAFTAVCLHHTRPEHVDAVREGLAHRQPYLPVLDTGDDGAAVTMVAALINAVRRARATLAGTRVLILDARAAPGIGALLTAAGARDLTFADSRTAGADLDDPPVRYDALIDLSAGAIATTGRPGPHRLHPLLALPGLLSVAVRRRIGIEVTNRFAAAHALARLAPPGRLLPDARDPRVTATIYDAAAGPVRPRRPR